MAGELSGRANVRSLKARLLRPSSIAVAIFALGAAACTTQSEPRFESLAPAERAATVEEGREIAANQCASCHAVGANDASARADAPPL